MARDADVCLPAFGLVGEDFVGFAAFAAFGRALAGAGVAKTLPQTMATVHPHRNNDDFITAPTDASTIGAERDLWAPAPRRADTGRWQPSFCMIDMYPLS